MACIFQTPLLPDLPKYVRIEYTTLVNNRCKHYMVYTLRCGGLAVYQSNTYADCANRAYKLYGKTEEELFV